MTSRPSRFHSKTKTFLFSPAPQTFILNPQEEPEFCYAVDTQKALAEWSAPSRLHLNARVIDFIQTSPDIHSDGTTPKKLSDQHLSSWTTSPTTQFEICFSVLGRAFCSLASKWKWPATPEVQDSSEALRERREQTLQKTHTWSQNKPTGM